MAIALTFSQRYYLDVRITIKVLFHRLRGLIYLVLAIKTSSYT